MVIIRKLQNDEWSVTKPDLPDYKSFCFNGIPKFCQVISGRNEKMCIDFFDKDWIHQSFHVPKRYPFAGVLPLKPKNYEPKIMN